MPITKAHCLLRLAASGFNFTDFKNYPRWFANDSTITLAQAGTFRGPNDIAEYVSFASDTSDYFDVSSTLPGDNVTVHSIDQDHSLCTFDIMRVSFYTFGKPAFAGPSAYVAYGLRMTMCIEELLFHTTAVYYPIPTMHAFFNSFFNTPDMNTYVCSTLRANCSTQWALSNWSAATPLDACVAKLRSLPLTEGGISYFNRNTMGCRVLHAEFARTDPSMHCPHLSFEPYPDDWGNLVCQPSEASPCYAIAPVPVRRPPPPPCR